MVCWKKVAVLFLYKFVYVFQGKTIEVKESWVNAIKDLMSAQGKVNLWSTCETDNVRRIDFLWLG